MLTKQSHRMVTLKMVMVKTPLRQLDELDELDDWISAQSSRRDIEQK
jgi:hypothetical protein